MKNKLIIFAVALSNILFLSGISFSMDSMKDQMVEYRGFLNEYGETITDEYRLAEGDDFSYWGTNREMYFYKIPDSRDVYKEPYWTKGDLNNDGRVDRCYILFSAVGKGAELICFISEPEGKYDLIKVAPAKKPWEFTSIQRIFNPGKPDCFYTN